MNDPYYWIANMNEEEKKFFDMDEELYYECILTKYDSLHK